jgi:hypothetical protein
MDSPSDTSFKPPNTGWGTTIGSFLSAGAFKLPLAVSNTPTTAKPADTSTFPYLSSAIHERFGEPEGSPLFNGVTPATSPSGAMAPASIDAVLLNSSASAEVVKVPQERGVAL